MKLTYACLFNDELINEQLIRMWENEIFCAKREIDKIELIANVTVDYIFLGEWKWQL